MNLLQNTPVACRNCGTSVPGREAPVRKADGSLVSECSWRCQNCGSFVKIGITRIIEPAKK